MKGAKRLEEAIIKARILKVGEDQMLPINALVEMYKNDDWIILPIFQDGKDGYNFGLFNVPEHEEFGNLLVAFTDMKYFNNVFGDSVINFSIRKAIEVMNAYKDECNGLLINPATHNTECVLFKKGINALIKTIEE